jgi:hypothetical protein
MIRTGSSRARSRTSFKRATTSSSSRLFTVARRSGALMPLLGLRQTCRLGLANQESEEPLFIIQGYISWAGQRFYPGSRAPTGNGAYRVPKAFSGTPASLSALTMPARVLKRPQPTRKAVWERSSWGRGKEDTEHTCALGWNSYASHHLLPTENLRNYDPHE